MAITDALIPVYENGQENQSGFRFHTDDALVCMMVNHLFETQPDLFGDADKRMDLKDEIELFLLSNVHRTKYDPPILPFLSGILSINAINPFEKARVAFLGGADFFPHNVFGDEAQNFRSLFQAFRDFHPERSRALTIENSTSVIAKGKYDYVMTGNVLNFPSLPNVKDTFSACANILKPDGLALHGLNYSPRRYDTILSEDFHTACGAVRIDENKPKFYPLKNCRTIDALILKQVSDVSISAP